MASNQNFDVQITEDTPAWVETANADNVAATATRAAETGKSHYVTSVSASFSASVAGALLTISEGAAEIARVYVHDHAEVSLPKPIEIAEGTAVSAELAASGSAGVVGAVNLTGYTV